MDLLATAAALSLIIALRYVVVAGVLHALLWRGSEPRLRAARLNTRAPTRAAIGHELRASLIASPIYAFPAAVALSAFEHSRGRLYLDPAQYGWAWLPVSALLYLLVQDAYYYWVHRVLHHRVAFAWAHAAHHRSREPTAFASFAFDAAEAAATAWLLPAMTFFVPLNLWVALGLLTLMSASAALNHCGYELLPSRWLRSRAGSWLISATHHSRHHTHMRSNYGLYFRFWDRLMGTDAMPEPSPIAQTALVGERA